MSPHGLRQIWVAAIIFAIVWAIILLFVPSKCDQHQEWVKPAQAERQTGRIEHNLHHAKIRMLRLTNDDRREHGLNRLRLNRHICRHAQAHTKAMAEKGYLFHSTPKQMENYLEEYRWHTIGENIGMGGTLFTLQKAFMDSPPHRANVLNEEFRRMSVGTLRRDGVRYLTVIYYG